MTTEPLRLVLRRRVRAFIGATAVVGLLWLLAVLAVNAFASSPPVADRHVHLSQGAVRFPIGVVRGAAPQGGVRPVFFHNPGGSPVDLRAWHTAAQCLILVTLAALVAAGLDRLRRKARTRQRAQMI